MPYIELLNILKITCDVISNPLESRKFESQTTKLSNSPSFRTKRALHSEADIASAHDNNEKMPDYFRSSTNKVADKRTSMILTKKLYNEFNDIFLGIDCFRGKFSLQIKDGANHIK